MAPESHGDERKGGEQSLTITLPIPTPLLTPNLQLHWAVKARHVADQKEAAMWATFVQVRAMREKGAEFLRVIRPPMVWEVDKEARKASRKQAPPRPMRLDVVVHPRPRMKEHDDDNFWGALKATRDGVAEAMGVDDKRFVMGTLVWDKKQRTGELIIKLTLTAAG